MDVTEKLRILADAAKYDASCASSGSKRKNLGGIGNTEGMGICHSYTPDGRCVSLLKILLSNACIFDCAYCINRASSEVSRAKFTVDEVVDLTLEFYRRNYIEGLFLSSGVVRSPDETFEEMIDVARRLRRDHLFGGYIHLKAVAGCSSRLMFEAGKWADRLSANIEFPTQKELDTLAPGKEHASIENAMESVRDRIDETREDKDKKLRHVEAFAPGGQSTQILVGASPSSDQAILSKASTLYQKMKLRRVYYTAYSPIQSHDARLPPAAPPLVREHRLYQADWLLRFYGFKVDELTPEAKPDLDLNTDPKMAWALRHPQFFPIDVNRAPRELLLRTPGLGVRSVDQILSIRRYHALTVADLKRLRVAWNRAQYFLSAKDGTGNLEWLSGGQLPKKTKAKVELEQLSLFDAPMSAASGEL